MKAKTDWLFVAAASTFSDKNVRESFYEDQVSNFYETGTLFSQHFTFHNTFRANFLLPKKLQSQTVIREKLHKTLLIKGLV